MMTEQDWSLLEATQASLREHMAEIRRLLAVAYQALDALHVGNQREAFLILYEALSKPEQAKPQSATSKDSLQVQAEIERARGEA